MDIFNKIKILRKEKPILVVAGGNKELFQELAERFLNKKRKFSISDLSEKSEKSLKKSLIPVLIALGSEENLKSAIENLPGESRLALNRDDEQIKGLEKTAEEKGINFLSFAAFNQADLSASDIKEEEKGINFKANYKGYSVPFWIREAEEKDILSVLAVISAGLFLGMNLVDISQSLKSID